MPEIFLGYAASPSRTRSASAGCGIAIWVRRPGAAPRPRGSERLAKGTLSAQGLVSLSGRANKTPFSVTGGTGAYDGARGSALVTDVNSTTTDIQITLRP